MRRVRSGVQVVLALAAMVGLLGGVPWALLRWGDWPITGVPTLEQVIEAPTALASDHVLLGMVTVALWVCWGLFTASVIAEVVAQLRGGVASVNLGGPVQRLAAFLVGAILLGVGAGSPAGASPGELPTGVEGQLGTGGLGVQAIAAEATMPDVLAFPLGADDEVVPGAVREDPAEIVVRRDDTAWSLAQRHLGDGMRWREIWELNRDRPQAGGSTWANAGDQVQAGWHLALPPDAEIDADDAVEAGGQDDDGPILAEPVSAAGNREGDPDGGEGADTASDDDDVVVVQRGDHFWSIAEAQLTQAWGRAPADAEMVGYWQELVDANRDRLLPPHDPDLIYPEQVFTVPVPPPDPAAPSDDEASTGGQEADESNQETSGADEPDEDEGGGEPESPDASGAEAERDDGALDSVEDRDVEGSGDDRDERDEDASGSGGRAGNGDAGESVDDRDAQDEGALGSGPAAEAEEGGEPLPPAAADEEAADRGLDGSDERDHPNERDAAESGTSVGSPTDLSVDGPEDSDELDDADVPVNHGPPVTNQTGLPTEPEPTDDAQPEESVASDATPDGEEAEGEWQPSEAGPPVEGSSGSPGGGDGDPDSEPRGSEPGEDASTGREAGEQQGFGTVPGTESAQAPGMPAGAVSDVAEDDGDRSATGSIIPVGLVGGGVALAGVLLLLERRRRAQQRHRDRGKLIALPGPELREREGDLRHGADVDAAKLLDAALRAAAAGCGTTGLPGLRWVEARPGVVRLILDGPSPAPPGFRNLAPDHWESTRDAGELAVMGASAAPPVPSLVPVGVTADGSEVLVELESSVVVTVTGPDDDVRGLLRGMAVAAATAPWNEQARVLLVGMEGELGDVPGVQSADSFDGALDEAERHAGYTVAALRAIRCPTTAQARAAGATPEEWDPLIVLSAVFPGADQRRRLRALVSGSHAGVGLVMPAVEAPLPARTFTIDDGSLRIDGVDVPVLPRLLSEVDAANVAGLLDVADRREAEADQDEVVEPEPIRRPTVAPAALLPDLEPLEPIRREPLEELLGDLPATDEGRDTRLGVGVPDERGDEPGNPVATVTDLAPADDLGLLLDEVEVLVRVLGEVEAVRLDPGEPGDARRGAERREEKLVPTRQKGLEAVAYLALREAAVDREDLESALFRRGDNAAKTLYNTISAARALVGEGLFPREGGRYELSERVMTDYGLFCELVSRAEATENAAAAADLLTGALSLVRGEPFMGVGRGYAWVGAHRGMIVAQVIDAADELGEIRLAQGDWRAAEWAARQGLRSFPADERMYRLLMRTAQAAGNPPGIQRVFSELCEVIADPDFGVEPEDTLHPETVALFEELTARSPTYRQMGA